MSHHHEAKRCPKCGVVWMSCRCPELKTEISEACQPDCKPQQPKPVQIKQDPKNFVVCTMMGGSHHVFQVKLEWKPTPDLSGQYANMNTGHCDERCNELAQKQAEELSAFIRARLEASLCRLCWDVDARLRERFLKEGP